MNRIEQSLRKEVKFLGRHIRSLARQGEPVPLNVYAELAAVGRQLQVCRERKTSGTWKPHVPKNFPGLRVNSQ